MTEHKRKIFTLFSRLDPVRREAILAVVQSMISGADAKTAIRAGNVILIANGLEPMTENYSEEQRDKCSEGMEV